MEERLNHLAAQTGRTQSDYITEAICEYLDDLEDLVLAERAMEDIRAGRTQTIPLEEVLRQYGMEG